MELERVLHEAGEDYLETILKLEDESGQVRSVDVANALSVSRPSVNKAVGVLKKAGMVEQKPYGRIYLTEKGREQASEVAKRHALLRLFLIDVLAVDPETADNDACKMEHAVSDVTMKKLADYIADIAPNKTTP